MSVLFEKLKYFKNFKLKSFDSLSRMLLKLLHYTSTEVRLNYHELLGDKKTSEVWRSHPIEKSFSHLPIFECDIGFLNLLSIYFDRVIVYSNYTVCIIIIRLHIYL